MVNRIELSKEFVIGTGRMVNRIVANGASHGAMKAIAGLLCTYAQNLGVNYTNVSGQATDVGGSVLTIMKGTPPTSISQISPNMVVSEVNARSTDVLLAFQANSNFDHFSPSQFKVNPAIISTVFVPAINTGTATWFWLRNYGGYTAAGVPALIGQSVIGAVGLLGSGSDLEMADVNILSGDNYRISAMKLEFPTSWEF